MIAAGGVAGPAAVAALLAAGAGAVAVGTLLLRTDESGASRTHQDALADPAFTDTVLTRAFTGPSRPRPAQPVHRYLRRRSPRPATPRSTTSRAGCAGRQPPPAMPTALHLWAGTGYRNARTGPARAVIDWLASDL